MPANITKSFYGSFVSPAESVSGWGMNLTKVIKSEYHRFCPQHNVIPDYGVLTGVCSSRHSRSGNQQVALALADWVFKQQGVLRVGKVKHYKVGENTPPAAYTIEDNVVSKTRILNIIQYNTIIY